VARKDSAAVKRVMTEGRDAGVSMFGQVLFQPLFLGRTLSASAHSGRHAVGIERNHVPIPKIKTVVALFRCPRPCSPIGKIGRAAAEVVFMVAGSWLGALFEAAPGRSVAIAKLQSGPAFVRQVSRREHRTGNPLNESGRGLGSGQHGTGCN